MWVALSQTYWRLHKNADAEEAAGKAAAFAPEDAAVLQGLAIYYSETNQTLKAAQAQAKYAAKVPDNQRARDHAIELYFEAARPLLDQQKFAEARRDSAAKAQRGCRRARNWSWRWEWRITGCGGSMRPRMRF